MHNLLFDEAPFRAWMRRTSQVQSRGLMGWLAAKMAHLSSTPGVTLPRADRIEGPLDAISHRDAQRVRALDPSVAGKGRESHYFVWASGHPPKPHQTKLGGLPYLPSNVDWPRDKNGAPTVFLGQLNFQDSRHLLRFDLPGDILLLFHDDTAWEPIARWVDAPRGEADEEWNNLGLSDLIPDTMAMKRVAPMAGYLCPIVEYPIGEEEEGGCESGYPWQPGTKIGGEPAWIQGEDGGPERFVAQFDSLMLKQPHWPLLNVERGFGGWSNYRSISGGQANPLMIGDLGSCYVFVQSDGKTEVVYQCY